MRPGRGSSTRGHPRPHRRRAGRGRRDHRRRRGRRGGRAPPPPTTRAPGEIVGARARQLHGHARRGHPARRRGRRRGDRDRSSSPSPATPSGCLSSTLGARSATSTTTFDKFLQLGFTGIRFGLIIAITAIGLSLIFGTTGLTNFAHGEMVTFGGIVAWYVNVDCGLRSSRPPHRRRRRRRRSPPCSSSASGDRCGAGA